MSSDKSGDKSERQKARREAVNAEFLEQGRRAIRAQLAYAAELGITAKDISRMTGVNQNMFSQWNKDSEAGKGPSFGEVVAIAKAIGFDLPAYLKENVTPEPSNLNRQVMRAHKLTWRLGRAVVRFEQAVREIQGNIDGDAAASEPDGNGARSVPGVPTFEQEKRAKRRRNGGA